MAGHTGALAKVHSTLYYKLYLWTGLYTPQLYTLVPRVRTASERLVSSRACHRLIYVGQGRVAPSHLEHLAPVGLAVLEGAHRLAREATVRLRVRVRVRVRLG